MLKGFPEVRIPDNIKDTCFARVKAAFAKAYPALPNNLAPRDIVAKPHPRFVGKLPLFSFPTYRSGALLFVPYRIPTSNFPMLVPFYFSTAKLAITEHPVMLPFPQLTASQPKYGREYPIYIPFMAKAVKRNSGYFCGSSVWLPFPGGKKEFFYYKSFRLPVPEPRSAPAPAPAPRPQAGAVAPVVQQVVRVMPVILPAPEPIPILPAPEPIPILPAPEPMPILPAPEPMPILPAPEPMPILPVPEPMPILPAPEPMPILPAPEPMPILPAPIPIVPAPMPIISHPISSVAVIGGGATVIGGGASVSGGGAAVSGGGSAVIGGGAKVSGGGVVVSGGGPAVIGGGAAVIGGGGAVGYGGFAPAASTFQAAIAPITMPAVSFNSFAAFPQTVASSGSSKSKRLKKNFIRYSKNNSYLFLF
jgi:hypothetical protein